MTERRTAVPSVLKLRDTPHLAFGAGSTVDHDSLATLHPRNEALVSVRCGHFGRAKQVISTRLPQKPGGFCCGARWIFAINEKGTIGRVHSVEIVKVRSGRQFLRVLIGRDQVRLGCL